MMTNEEMYSLNEQTLISKKNKQLLNSILFVFALTEKAISKENIVYWDIDTNLDKHRETREFDNHLNKIFLYIKKFNNFEARVTSCGDYGLYKTELFDAENDFIFHFCHSNFKNSKYMKKYFEMNTDDSKVSFSYIQYNLNKQRDKIVSIEYVVPDTNGNPVLKINLLDEYVKIREKISSILDFDVSSIVYKMKQELSENNSILFLLNE